MKEMLGMNQLSAEEVLDTRINLTSIMKQELARKVFTKLSDMS